MKYKFILKRIFDCDGIRSEKEYVVLCEKWQQDIVDHVTGNHILHSIYSVIGMSHNM